MKALLLLSLSVFALSSCVESLHIAKAQNGNYEFDRVRSLGGTSSQKGADGSSFTHDHQASFQVGAQTVGAVVGGIATAVVNDANNANLAAEQLAKTHATQAANAGLIGNAKPIVTTPTPLGNPTVTIPAAPVLLKP